MCFYVNGLTFQSSHLAFSWLSIDSWVPNSAGYRENSFQTKFIQPVYFICFPSWGQHLHQSDKSIIPPSLNLWTKFRARWVFLWICHVETIHFSIVCSVTGHLNIYLLIRPTPGIEISKSVYVTGTFFGVSSVHSYFPFVPCSCSLLQTRP